MTTSVGYDKYAAKVSLNSTYGLQTIVVADNPNRVLVCFGLWRGAAAASALLINGVNTGLSPIAEIRNQCFYQPLWSNLHLSKPADRHGDSEDQHERLA